MFFEVQNLEKSFGGVKATDNVSLHINEGDICSLIGPNGAGKSTFFNLITGYIRPDSGKVIFLGEDITGKTAMAIARKGIARSFQIVNIFPQLTAYENVMVAVLSQKKRSFNVIHPAKKIDKDEIYGLLQSTGLEQQAQMLGGQLSHGNQKRLEVAIALALKPKLLALDEPTAGMAEEEKSAILETIKTLMKMTGCTILLCEHDMSVIFSISDQIWVLHNGRIVANGNVEEIKNNEVVQRIYLGGRE
ncbi:MAG: ABC transporter ATP-binding protein [Syntrophales bacterium]|nr:ABC transporter ATP-binding protein [Syntrophales bacterium]MDY0044121.1 ABC transporter ATP-binding protein [Syntrophales bacterium]